MCECNLCVDFFIPFTKLKDCKSHVCFCFFNIFQLLLVSPPHPITLRTLHLNTLTLITHTCLTQWHSYFYHTATWHVCKSQLYYWSICDFFILFYFYLFIYLFYFFICSVFVRFCSHSSVAASNQKGIYRKQFQSQYFFFFLSKEVLQPLIYIFSIFIFIFIFFCSLLFLYSHFSVLISCGFLYIYICRIFQNSSF